MANSSTQIPKCLTKKAFLAHRPVVLAVDKWREKPLELRMLHRVTMNWLDDAPLSKEEFRAKWIREPQVDRILHGTYISDASGIYRPSIIGMAILVACAAKGTSSLMNLCANAYAQLRKNAHQSRRGQAAVPFFDLCQLMGAEPKEVERALLLLSDTGLGMNIVRDSKGFPLNATAQEYVLQYRTLWIRMAWQVEVLNNGEMQSSLTDMFSAEKRDQYAAILAVVPDAPIHLSRCLEWINNEPDAAITSSRTLMEATLKWIAHDAQKEPEKTQSVDKLFKRCMEAIGLDDDAKIGVMDMVNGMNTALIGLADLRNARGNSHGAHPSQPSATRRHARLAVSLSVALSTYFVEAYEAAK